MLLPNTKYIVRTAICLSSLNWMGFANAASTMNASDLNRSQKEFNELHINYMRAASILSKSLHRQETDKDFRKKYSGLTGIQKALNDKDYLKHLLASEQTWVFRTPGVPQPLLHSLKYSNTAMAIEKLSSKCHQLLVDGTALEINSNYAQSNLRLRHYYENCPEHADKMDMVALKLRRKAFVLANNSNKQELAKKIRKVTTTMVKSSELKRKTRIKYTWHLRKRTLKNKRIKVSASIYRRKPGGIISVINILPVVD